MIRSLDTWLLRPQFKSFFKIKINDQIESIKATCQNCFLCFYRYRKWYSCAPSQLFALPVAKAVKGDSNAAIKRTLEREARRAQWLIIWTDCDRDAPVEML